MVDKPKESDCGMLKPEALIMQDTLEQHTDSLGNQLLKKWVKRVKFSTLCVCVHVHNIYMCIYVCYDLCQCIVCVLQQSMGWTDRQK